MPENSLPAHIHTLVSCALPDELGSSRVRPATVREFTGTHEELEASGRMVTRSLKPSLLPTLPFGRNTPEEGLPGPDELHLVSQDHISRPKTPFSPRRCRGLNGRKSLSLRSFRGAAPQASHSR